MSTMKLVIHTTTHRFLDGPVRIESCVTEVAEVVDVTEELILKLRVLDDCHGTVLEGRRGRGWGRRGEEKGGWGGEGGEGRGGWGGEDGEGSMGKGVGSGGDSEWCSVIGRSHIPGMLL